MRLLKTVSPEKAEGETKECYSVIPEGFEIPDPLVTFSASPGWLKLQTDMIRYYVKQANLSYDLLTHIRYVAAVEFDFAYCDDFNAKLLTEMGLSEEDMAALARDPGKAKLDEREKAMLMFVVKALKSPDEVTGEDVDSLREMGWTDRDIFDAVHHGATLAGVAVTYFAFNR